MKQQQPRPKLFKILLVKTYFDKGWGLLGQIKYLILLFGFLEGIRTQSIHLTIVAGVVYCAVCYLIGRIWYKNRFVDVEMEISNIFNPFANDVRKKLKIRKVYKA